jgi:hypothetical protein
VRLQLGGPALDQNHHWWGSLFALTQPLRKSALADQTLRLVRRSVSRKKIVLTASTLGHSLTTLPLWYGRHRSRKFSCLKNKYQFFPGSDLPLFFFFFFFFFFECSPAYLSYCFSVNIAPVRPNSSAKRNVNFFRSVEAVFRPVGFTRAPSWVSRPRSLL